MLHVAKPAGQKSRLIPSIFLTCFVFFPWEGLCEAPGVSAEPRAGRDKEQKLVSPRDCVSSYVCVHLRVEDSVVGGHGCLPALF